MTFDPPLELRDGQHVTATDGRWLLCDAHGDVIQDLTVRPGPTWAVAVDEAWNRANARAEALLLEHLDEKQRASYEDHGTFLVEVGGERGYYKLGVPGRAAVCPEINRWYCLEPEKSVPRADQLLAIKLWLEADEAGFLGRANEFVLNSEQVVYSYWMDLSLAEEEQRHQRAIADLQRDFQERLADEERRFQERVAEIRERGCTDQREWADNARRFLGGLNCSFEVAVREPCGPLHFSTLDDARAWLETHTLEYELDDLLGDMTYTINGRPSDRHSWELLMEADGG